jgi:PmbA protein
VSTTVTDTGAADRAEHGELLELCRSIASDAAPGEQVEAYAARGRDTDLDVFDGEIESLTIAESEGVGIRVVRDGRQGFAWCASFEPDVVADTLAEARDNARFAEPESWNGLATLDDVAGDAPELELFDARLVAVTTEQKVAFTLELDARVRGADPRVRGVEKTSYGDATIEAALASSLGVEAATRRTIASAASAAIAEEGSSTQTGYGFSVARAFEDLDAERIVELAVERSTRLLGARQPATRRLPVILDPMVTASFLGVLAAAFNGESALKGRSLFLERVGEQVAATIVQIADDPTDGRSLGASTHDGEGVPSRRNDLVVDGVFRGFLHNTMTARRATSSAPNARTRTTASAVRGAGYRGTPGVGVGALQIAPGDLSPDAAMASVPEALYVQAVHGIHSGTNPISGDFSVGAEGLMVRDGAYAEPVRELTIASTLPRMLLDVAAVCDDVTFLPGGTASLTLLVGDMTMSGS